MGTHKHQQAEIEFRFFFLDFFHQFQKRNIRNGD